MFDRKAWSREEIDSLKKLYPTTSTKKMAEILGRSSNSVEWKALYLGLKKDKEYRIEVLRRAALLATSARYKLWTEEELTLLKKLYWKTSQKELLKTLPGRTWSSILQKAAKLGLKREDPRIGKVTSKMSIGLQIRPEDAGWLAGIIDGEGTITVLSDGTPWVSICNTNVLLLDKVRHILESCNIPYSECIREGNRIDKRGIRHIKTTTEIRIVDNGYVYALLTKLLPLLTAKKEQTNIIVEYIRKKFIERDIKGAKKIIETFRFRT